ncbi:ERBB receptor feedback inhibitor 1a [Conger conger]|uniref:ERBB receptor feedback inhibitor 1a n=1 Tax=Conger conger TaxID=82655 RepID=UPI002A5A1C99|nr:ERBB receptor feedback inhibitor 1a [Conger conger]
MASDKPSWSPPPELDRSCLGLDATPLEQNHRTHQQVPASERQHSHPHSPGAQRLPPKKPRPSQLSLSSGPEASTASPSGDDQVVPSFQRLSVYERSPPHTPSRAPSRGSRPLPPLPGPVELTAGRPAEDDVEFFSGVEDSRRLVPEPCPKLPPLRPSDPARHSFRGCGQVNQAYREGPCGAHVPLQPREDWYQKALMPQEQATPSSRDRAHRRLRRSHSGPALRQPCARHGNLSQDKPQVPPRIPIPPRTFKTTDPTRRWSTEVSSGRHSDEDRPPKVPPREPISSQTPSPKSLPTYLNGVMPPTQSFAPDPKYVSRTLRRQHSEGSPCILPIMEQGRKASHTHYFLLPQRPAYLDRLERFLRGAECEQRCQGESGPGWNSVPHTDLV